MSFDILSQYKTSEKFTKDEAYFIEPFFSNLDKNVFVAKLLPSEVLGALASRYSRSTKGVRKLFYDEYVKPILEPDLEGVDSKTEKDAMTMRKELVSLVDYLHTHGGWEAVVNSKRARGFFSKWLAAYGDDSIAQMAGAHIFFENISSLACDFLQEFRIGFAPLEKSTRYVLFDQKIDGRWLYYVDGDLDKSQFSQEYIKLMNTLFKRYAGSVEPLSLFLKKRFKQEKDQTDRAYKETIKAKTCDVLRAYLPVATLTNSGFFGVGQALEYVLAKSYASEIREVRDLAKIAQIELEKVIPSLVERASSSRGKVYQNYVRTTERQMRRLTDSIAGDFDPQDFEADSSAHVELVDFDWDAENRIVASLLYKNSNLPYRKLKEEVGKLSSKERASIIETAVGRRKVRQHRLIRSFENTYYKFDIVANIGAYRDLHRHRMLTGERQFFTTELGFDVPADLVSAKLEKPYLDSCEAIAKFYKKISKKFPYQAQYVVMRGNKVRWYQFENLRELGWEAELRTGPQGHPDYRTVEHEKVNLVKKIHPALVEALKFVDFADYDLARRESEKRTDRKLVLAKQI